MYNLIYIYNAHSQGISKKKPPIIALISVSLFFVRLLLLFYNHFFKSIIVVVPNIIESVILYGVVPTYSPSMVTFALSGTELINVVIAQTLNTSKQPLERLKVLQQ